jgi:hypothetical protein
MDRRRIILYSSTGSWYKVRKLSSAITSSASDNEVLDSWWSCDSGYLRSAFLQTSKTRNEYQEHEAYHHTWRTRTTTSPECPIYKANNKIIEQYSTAKLVAAGVPCVAGGRGRPGILAIEEHLGSCRPQTNSFSAHSIKKLFSHAGTQPHGRITWISKESTGTVVCKVEGGSA